MFATSLAAAATLATSAQAGTGTILYDTATGPYGGYNGLNYFQYFADSFSTGPSAFDLTDIHFILTSISGGPTDIAVFLYSDNGTNLGAQIAQLTGVPQTFTSGNQDFDFTGNVELSANTRYWALITGESYSFAGVDYTANLTGAEATTEFWTAQQDNGYNLGIIPNGGNVPSMEVVGVPAPEPTTVALAGLAGTAWLLRQRKQA